MALVNMTCSSCCRISTRTHHPNPPPPPFSRTLLPSPSSARKTHVAHARKGLSSRTKRKNDGSLNTKEGGELGGAPPPPPPPPAYMEGVEMSTGPMPKLEGLEASLVEGAQWDALGFVVQYLWAFGIVFALIACGIAVATYNDGATDFKLTPAYKESIESQELLEEPDSSTSDVFEGNPTEVAPSLD